MDCCNYAAYGAPAPWEGYAPPAPPYAPYAHAYYAPHAHDPYSRYYRLDYSPQHHHLHHAEHNMHPDYGAYAAKEVRARRALARRERVHPSPQHLPLPPTPPLEVGMNGRGPVYGEPQIWPHYQMGVLNGGGWGGAHPSGGGWARGACSREHMRYPSDCRQIKGPQLPSQSTMCQQDGRSTPYPGYEDASPSYNGENTRRHETTHHFSSVRNQADNTRPPRDRYFPEPRRTPPEEKRPPVVPLPAFQQAFGSTEIGKFSEAFTRTETAQEDVSADNFLYESFTEWDGLTEPQWSTQPAAREIKCEDNY